jgi:hypothetical protein
MNRTTLIFKTNGTRSKASEAIDVAARYFVYKLYEATDRRSMAWHELHGMGEERATVARAVQRGWVVVQPSNSGSVKEQSGCLTDEGRALARKGSRG